eukprot:1055625-Prorocentrum_minimum.AAC.3
MLPDDRCIGGRQAAELELYSMRRKISNAKAKVGSVLRSSCVLSRQEGTISVCRGIDPWHKGHTSW